MAIDFKRDLNPAQLEAALAPDGPVLVIAGAGSGKTRTIVYRLAHLAQRGVPPESILLLTFTRKASQEMLERAGRVLGMEHGPNGLGRVNGGTFHSFAYSVLRRNASLLGFADGFTVMDRGDCEEVLGHVKTGLGIGKGDRSFPKRGTILELVSKSRNKEMDLADVLHADAFHLLPYEDDIARLDKGYRDYKLAHGLMDYDDLLFGLEGVLHANEELRHLLRTRIRHVLVDEYQDTNLVQARLVKLLAGGGEEGGNVMAVGDDAQSIYAFRGANVRNILDFPTHFPGTKIVRLEQNYRSLQPILDLTNHILDGARERYDKKLFSHLGGTDKPELMHPLSDLTQAQIVARKVMDLSRTMPLHEIAVLFRAGYQSYPLEVLLNKVGIPFQKYGGLRFSDAAHVKDVLALLRLVLNPADMPAWMRSLSHIKGFGPATSAKLFEAVLSGDTAYVLKQRSKRPELGTLLDFLDQLRALDGSPAHLIELVMTYYLPILIESYPDDYPRRQAGLEQLGQIGAAYHSLDSFLADLSLDNPSNEDSRDREDKLVLSTVHSAKGLEWTGVLVIDLVQDRFPSKHALFREDDLEEERRLLYVACTRARRYLGLFVPATLYNRYQDRSEPAVPSPFVRELPADSYVEWQETYAGGLAILDKGNGASRATPDMTATEPAIADWSDDQTAGQYPSAPASKPGQQDQGRGVEGARDARTILQGRRPGGWSPSGNQGGWRDRADRAAGGFASSGIGGTGGAGYGSETEYGDLANHGYAPPINPTTPPEKLGYCRHKIFGRGKIVAEIPPGKYRVNFPGFGLKVIMADYLVME